MTSSKLTVRTENSRRSLTPYFKGAHVHHGAVENSKRNVLPSLSSTASPRGINNHIPKISFNFFSQLLISSVVGTSMRTSWSMFTSSKRVFTFG